MTGMESRQPNLYIASSVTLFASTAALILRLLARRTMKFNLWWDDYLAIVAWMFGAGATIFVLFWLPLGLGLHLEDAARLRHESTNSALSHNLLFLWISDYLYSFSLGFTKLSVLCFYWRIFGLCMTKVGIQVLGVMSIMWICMRMILTNIQCLPVQAYWDLTITDKYCPIQANKFFIGSVVTHLFIEFSIIVLPIRKIWQLQLPMAQKVGIGAVFMSGIFIFTSSVVQLATVLTHNTESIDFTWILAPIIAWAVVEMNLSCFAISLPILRPVYVFYRRHKSLTRKSSPADDMSHSGRFGHPQIFGDMLRIREIEAGDSDSEITTNTTRSESDCCLACDGQMSTMKIVIACEDIRICQETASLDHPARS